MLFAKPLRWKGLAGAWTSPPLFLCSISTVEYTLIYLVKHSASGLDLSTYYTLGSKPVRS